ESCLEAAQAVDPAQGRIQSCPQPLLGQLDRTRNRGSEHTGIRNAVGDESIDLVELATGNLDTNVIQVETQNPFLDPLHIVRLKESERQLEVDSGFGLDVDDLAEAQHDRLLSCVDDEDGGIEQIQ